MNIKKLAILALVAGAVSLLGMPPAEAQFSLFGDATNVTGGIGNTRAIELTSRCSPFTGPPPTGTCDFTSFTFSGVSFQPSTPLTFAGISELSADFNVGATDCGAGSPRFQINLDVNGNGVFDPFPTGDGSVFVHFGPSPNFTSCVFGWQSTGNLIANNETGRYDSSQVGGSGFGTYTDAITAAGGATVLGIQLVVDSGWWPPIGQRGQAVHVDNIRINNSVLK